MGVFGIIDKVIISVVVIAVLGTITIIAYAVITALLEENEHTKRIKEDEKLRRKRLEKGFRALCHTEVSGNCRLYKW